ncbi:MAG: hypothetical protein ACT4PP_06115 [Sporichthyaceae bacterium]
MESRSRIGSAAALTGLTLALMAMHAAPSGARPVPPDSDTSNCAFVDDSNVETYAGGAEQAGSAPTKGEISAYSCLERVGNRITMHYGWSTVGYLQVGAFNFSIFDCSTGKQLPQTVRPMTYPRGSKKPSGQGSATFTLSTGKRYQSSLYGAGTYRRTQAVGLGQSGSGRFNNYEDPKFRARSVCG